MKSKRHLSLLSRPVVFGRACVSGVGTSKRWGLVGRAGSESGGFGQAGLAATKIRGVVQAAQVLFSSGWLHRACSRVLEGANLLRCTSFLALQPNTALKSDRQNAAHFGSLRAARSGGRLARR